MNQIAKWIPQTRIGLATKSMMLAYLIYGLEPAENEKIPYTATDGVHFFYNDKYINSLGREEKMGAMAVAIFQCASGHVWRRGGRDPKIWALASLICVAATLQAEGFKLPKEMSTDWQHGTKSVEQIYEILYKEQQEQQKAKVNPSPYGGGNYRTRGGEDKYGETSLQEPPPPAPPSDPQPGDAEGEDTEGDGDTGNSGGTGFSPEMKEMEWEAKTETAIEMATGAGMGQSPMVTRLADKLVGSKIPWTVEMQEFYVNALEQHESTWAAPNKKFLNLDLYLPSSRSHKIGPLAIGIDSSGSTEFYTEKFLAETSAVMAQCQPELLVIASVDTKVHEIFELRPGDPIPENVVQGGGGTDFRPFFKMIQKYEPAPIAIVFLTDMDTGADWPTDPGIPTLWVSTTAKYRKPPFGRVIVMV